MRTTRTLTVTVAAVVLAGLFLVGCSSEKTVAQADVEQQVATQLAAETGQDEPDVSCPDDLKAEVDATMECELTVAGDTAVYPVTVKVTSVEGDTANFSVEVGDTPK